MDTIEDSMEGYYWLKDGNEKPTLVYHYKNEDEGCWGFGFNIADGGGFLTGEDVTEETQVIKAEIKDIRPLVFLFKDDEATIKYDKLIDEYKSIKRELFSLLEQL